MEESLQNQLTQRMAELPPDIQSAVKSADLPNKIRAIGQKYQLHIDQIGLLEDEIMLVMLGFADPGEFVANIAAQVRVPAATATLIATDVSNELFLPIRESMQRFMEARAAKASEAAPPAQPLAVAVTPPTPTPPTPPSLPPSPVEPPEPQLPKADLMLSQKTITPPVSATTPPPSSSSPTPKPYNTDPYKEPIE